MGSLAVAGISGASLGTAGATLRATAGIQLVNLADPVLAGYDSEMPAPGREGVSTPASAEPLAPAGAVAEPGAVEEPGALEEPGAVDAERQQQAAQRQQQQAEEAAAQQQAAEEAARASVPVDDPAAARAFAASALPARGWEAAELTCLDKLWTKESEWLTSAVNPSSGAYGIAQSLPAEKMAAAGDDWKVSYSTQITWGLDYIASRYGSPCSALNFHYANNWY